MLVKSLDLKWHSHLNRIILSRLFRGKDVETEPQNGLESVRSLSEFSFPKVNSSVWEDIFLAEEIPWTGQPGGLQSMGLQRVEHD